MRLPYAAGQAPIGVVTQESHLFRETIRANLLHANSEASRQELRDALHAAQNLALVDSLPDGPDTLVGIGNKILVNDQLE